MASVSVPISVDGGPSASQGGGCVGITTLGCKVNTFESELISHDLRQRNWAVVEGKEIADVYVINTCTVTREADRQSRQQIRRVIRQNPEALVVVTGCYAQMDPEACAAIPGVDLVVGNGRKLDLHRLLPKLRQGKLPQVMVGDPHGQMSLPHAPLPGYEGHSRAFVQVQQGCDQGCTFCIIHQARGPSRSLSPTLIKRQLQRLIMNGYREVVICGVDLGAYGVGSDGPGTDPYGLADLLSDLVAVEGDFRIRLSSIDPAHIDSDLVNLLATEDKLCPHLHLSLQSGNTLILKRMKRRYTRELVYQRICALRERMPDLVLSADVMVGFPTETEEQFQDTVKMVQDFRIAYAHVFRYSARPGTPAARIPKQVAPQVMKQRAKLLRRVAAKVRLAVLRSRIGHRTRLLIEGGGHPPKGHQRARSGDYLPAFVPADSSAVGRWADVEFTDVQAHALIARPIG